MILSFEHDFIFIKTRKCGGTSIQETLTDICGPYDIVTLGYINQMNDLKGSLHEFSGLKELREKLRIDTDKFFKFGLTRNPFDITLSRYFFHIKRGAIIEPPSASSFNKWVKEKYIVDNSIAFDDRSRFNLFNSNLEPIVDYIGKLEDIDNVFRFLKQKLNLPRSLKLKTINVSNFNKIKYQDWFDDEARGLVEKHFDFEFKYFNYKF